MSEYRYLGNFAACEPWAAQGMSCDDCMVSWTGCWDNFQCPKCGNGELPNCELPNELSRRTNYSVISRIALAACSNELHDSRALGCDWIEAYGNAYCVLDEIREVIAQADPTPVLTRFKPHPQRGL